MLEDICTRFRPVAANQQIDFNLVCESSDIIGYLDEAEGVGIISAGGYCKYIEFGTGVKGRDSSHPSEEYKAIMNWAYNSGATIFTTKDGREEIGRAHV